jgi:hypothetical protein
MKLWELIPKADRPDAQVLVTLPNSETEYVEGFAYQEYHFADAARACATLTPRGRAHTRYRYRPRQLGTHLWLHRTPPGGTLEQGAFVVESLPEPAPPFPSVDVRTPSPDWDPPTFTLPKEGDELAGLQAIERGMANLPSENRCVRLRCDATTDAAGTDGARELARDWLLDAVLKAADEQRVAVVLRLPPPVGAETLQLHATLHPFLCRYAPLPALAAWELVTDASIGDAAARFLRSYDPYHPTLVARGAENV